MAGITVDILLTGTTGFVGRFVLRHILETETPTPSIAVVVRSSGSRSAQQRWREEMVASSLFADMPDKITKVHVIDAALENLEHTTLHISGARRIIHCAANVRHYDPFESLKRDNVENVRKVLRLATTLRTESLVLLSTCYVHPHAAIERPVKRIQGDLTPADFYNDYCYTKWLGEEAVFEAVPPTARVEIMRLSCVGSPLRWDLAAHPCAAQAHLGIASLALRGYLEVLAARSSSRISVIPVDIAAAAIVRASLGTADAVQPRIQQICPPPHRSDFHISLQSMMAALMGHSGFQGVITDDGGVHLPWWKQVFYRLSDRGRKALKLHEHVQDFVSTFSDPDIRFESSLEETEFPTVGDGGCETLAVQTLEYSVRILHDRRISRGIPMTLSDRFWHRLANHEPVQACMTLAVPIPAEEWPTYRTRLWNFFSMFRKSLSAITANGHEWGPNNGLRMDAYLEPPTKLETSAPSSAATAASILSAGLRSSSPEFLWSVKPFAAGQGSADITHILLRLDHGLTDGVGAIAAIPEFEQHVFGGRGDSVKPTDFRKPRSIPFWMDLWVGLVYVAMLAVLYFFPSSLGAGTGTIASSREASLSTVAYTRPPSLRKSERTEGVGGAAGEGTFTTDLIWTLAQRLARLTGEHEHIFAVPAAGSIFRNRAELPTNDFVPILLPVDAKASRESFEFRCMFLRAKSVRFLSWCIVRILEWGGFDGARDRMLSRVRCVVSSMQMGNGTPALKAIHVATTTPTPIPFCVVAMSAGDQTFLTVRSHAAGVPADRIAEVFSDAEMATAATTTTNEKNETATMVAEELAAAATAEP